MADSANFKRFTLIEFCGSLTGKCCEMQNVSYRYDSKNQTIKINPEIYPTKHPMIHFNEDKKETDLSDYKRLKMGRLI